MRRLRVLKNTTITSTKIHVSLHCFVDLGITGAYFSLTLTEDSGGIYICQADNGIQPKADRHFRISVECKVYVPWIKVPEQQCLMCKIMRQICTVNTSLLQCCPCMLYVITKKNYGIY